MADPIVTIKSNGVATTQPNTNPAPDPKLTAKPVAVPPTAINAADLKPLKPDPFNYPDAKAAITGVPTAPATVQPTSPAEPAKPDLNQKQAATKANISAAAKKDKSILEKPSEVRAVAAPAPSAEKAKPVSVEKKIVTPDTPKEETDKYDPIIAQAQKRMDEADAEAKKANELLDKLYASIQAPPEQAELAKINLQIAKSADEVMGELSKAGIPISSSLAQHLIDQHNSGLIYQQKALNDVIAQREKMFNMMKDIDLQKANAAARAFDQAFNIQGRMIDLQQKTQDRQQALDDKKQQMAKDRVTAAVTSGSLSYASDEELAGLAEGSGYTLEDLKNMRAAALDKKAKSDEATRLAQERVSIAEERLSLAQEKDTKMAKTKLGGDYNDIMGKLDASRQKEGQVGPSFVDVRTYEALRNKANDVTVFDQTFSRFLDPSDTATKQYVSQAEKKSMTTAEYNQLHGIAKASGGELSAGQLTKITTLASSNGTPINEATAKWIHQNVAQGEDEQDIADALATNLGVSANDAANIMDSYKTSILGQNQ